MDRRKVIGEMVHTEDPLALSNEELGSRLLEYQFAQIKEALANNTVPAELGARVRHSIESDTPTPPMAGLIDDVKESAIESVELAHVALIDDALYVRFTEAMRDGGTLRLALVVADLLRHAEKAFGWAPGETLRVVIRELDSPTSPLRRTH